MGLTEIEHLVQTEALCVFGAFHPSAEDLTPDGTRTLLLLGPREPGFWVHVTASPEFQDGAPNPLDRWSQRVISALAATLNATALFPFGGPPYQPFLRWAERSGRAWQSPAGPLVHDMAGMMVSYRGALALTEALDLPAPPSKPCDSCAQPCLTACPVSALSADQGYELTACHTHLDTTAGSETCMAAGCLSRRACPISQGYARLPDQSAFHMASFHPEKIRTP